MPHVGSRIRALRRSNPYEYEAFGADGGGSCFGRPRMCGDDGGASCLRAGQGDRVRGLCAWKVDAGFRGMDDSGKWGNGLYVKTTPSVETQVRVKETVAASVAGTALAAATVDMTGLPSLSVLVDGEAASSTTPLTFRAGDFPGGVNLATTAQIRDAINRQTANWSRLFLRTASRLR